MAERKEIAEFIRNRKLVAILRGVSKDKILDTAEAIWRGGILCLEVTIDHTSKQSEEETYEKIALLKQVFHGRIRVGAGTVLSEKEVEDAAKAGAEYIISPNVDAAVIRRTVEMGLVSMPGAFTPSEIVTARQAGADFVKVFPAGNLGIPYIKAVRGPLGHIPILAVGGVTPENASDFLRAGCVGLGIGGNLARLDLIAEGKFDEIEKVSRAYVEGIS